MKTQYFTATSLDGFIATEDHSLDWLFPLGDLNHSRACYELLGLDKLEVWNEKHTQVI